jgi:hypothetical protein
MLRCEIRPMYVCICIYVCIHMYVCVQVCMYLCTYMCTHTHGHFWMYARTRAHTLQPRFVQDVCVSSSFNNLYAARRMKYGTLCSKITTARIFQAAYTRNTQASYMRVHVSM